VIRMTLQAFQVSSNEIHVGLAGILALLRQGSLG
jgi:hypothetical protein